MKTPTTIDLNTQKIDLLQQLLAEESPTVLKEVREILERNRTVAYSTDGQPLTKEAYTAAVEKGLLDVAEGRTFSTEEVREKIKSWRKR